MTQTAALYAPEKNRNNAKTIDAYINEESESLLAAALNNNNNTSYSLNSSSNRANCCNIKSRKSNESNVELYKKQVKSIIDDITSVILFILYYALLFALGAAVVLGFFIYLLVTMLKGGDINALMILELAGLSLLAVLGLVVTVVVVIVFILVIIVIYVIL